jgi:hypothetical protein
LNVLTTEVAAVDKEVAKALTVELVVSLLVSSVFLCVVSSALSVAF